MASIKATALSIPPSWANRSDHNRAAGIHMNGDISQQTETSLIQFATVENNVIWENGAKGGSGI